MTWSQLVAVWLFLAGIDELAARVSPPYNVTLHCYNLTNILTWNYNNITPGLQFRVDVKAYYNEIAEGFRNGIWVQPPALQADVSFLSDPADEYELSVTAVMDNVESEQSPSDGLSFSYHSLALVSKTCALDLPSVHVIERPHDHIQLSFKHPWLVYREKLDGSENPQTKQKRSHDAPADLSVFEYKVIVVNQKNYSFQCEEEVCVKEVPVDPKHEEHCVKIEGNLEQLLIRGSQVYCVPSHIPADPTYIFMVVALLLIIAVLGVIIMVCYQKTRLLTQTTLPKTLDISSQLEQNLAHPDNESIDDLSCGAASPTPLLPNTQDGPRVDPQVEPDDVRLPLRPLADELNVPDGIEAPQEDAKHIQVCVRVESGYEPRLRVSGTSEGYRGAEDLEHGSGADSTSEEQ